MHRMTHSSSLDAGDEPAEDSPLGPAVIHNWSLLTGYRVHVRLNRNTLRSGQVENVTSDGRALWLGADDRFGRQLIDQGSGYQVLLDPDQLPAFRRHLEAITSSTPPPESAKKR